MNELTDPEPIPLGVDYASLIESDVPIVVQHTRLDSRQAENTNARCVWQEMGEPKYLSRVEVEQLQAASRIVKEPMTYEYRERAIGLKLDLPPHGVAAITIELAPE